VHSDRCAFMNQVRVRRGTRKSSASRTKKDLLWYREPRRLCNRQFPHKRYHNYTLFPKPTIVLPYMFALLSEPRKRLISTYRYCILIGHFRLIYPYSVPNMAKPNILEQTWSELARQVRPYLIFFTITGHC